MKIRNLVIILCGVLVLNSCIVKSLQPFYIKDSISFNEAFLGEWKDGKNDIWKVESLAKIFEKEGIPKKPTKEEQEMLEAYKYAYSIEYSEGDKSSTFVAVPFKIEGQLFLDFTPLSEGTEALNKLHSKHLIHTHSLVKFDITSNNEISVKWLTESKLKELYTDNKMRLKHEVVGVGQDLVLTATSNELYNFVKKYNSSNIEKKWETSSKYKLTRVDAKP
jgi:hypothetical protein